MSCKTFVDKNFSSDEQMDLRHYARTFFKDSVIVFVMFFTSANRLDKYIMPMSCDVGVLHFKIRMKMREINVASHEALVTMVEDGSTGKCFLVLPNQRVGDLVEKYSGGDCFLFISVLKENVFG